MMHFVKINSSWRARFSTREKSTTTGQMFGFHLFLQLLFLGPWSAISSVWKESCLWPPHSVQCSRLLLDLQVFFPVQTDSDGNLLWQQCRRKQEVITINAIIQSRSNIFFLPCFFFLVEAFWVTLMHISWEELQVFASQKLSFFLAVLQSSESSKHQLRRGCPAAFLTNQQRVTASPAGGLLENSKGFLDK